MPYKPFDRYDYDDARQLFGPQEKVSNLPGYVQSIISGYGSTVKVRRSQTAIDATEYYSGNHWLGGRGFIGQMPPDSLQGAATIRAAIEAGFVSENVIKEVIKTHVGGILGREPTWSFLPREKGVKKPEPDRETGETLTAWWNERKALVDFQKACRISLLEGMAVRRVFIPRGRVTDGTIRVSNLSDALNYIYFETHTADRAGVFTDPDTQQDIGVYFFEERNEQGDVTASCAELSFLDADRNTVCKVVKDKGAPEEFGPYRLNGHLLVFQIDRDALITDQIQSSQRAINLAHTMMMRNVNMAGARERTVMNAQPPIEERRVHDSATEVTKTVIQPGKFHTGAGAVMFLMGYPIYDDNGEIKGYTNPNVTISDPVTPDAFTNTINAEKQAIYSGCHQRHVLIVDKADTSGRAREVARREFERSLKESKTVLDACGRWQLESSLYLAAQLIRQSERYLKLRADFNCLLDAGDPDPEKQKTAALLRQPGGVRQQPLISDETARNWAGVEDAAAELARIEKEGQQPPAEPTPPPEGVTQDVDQVQSLVQ